MPAAFGEMMAVVAAALGVSLSLGVVYAGARLRESELDPHERWMVVVSGVGGGLFTAGAYGLTLVARVVERRALVEPAVDGEIGDATEVIKEAVISVAGERGDVTVETDIEPGLRVAGGDALFPVFSDLVGNAVEDSDLGGAAFVVELPLVAEDDGGSDR